MNAYRDPDEDDWDEDEVDLGDDSGDEPTVPCPYCRREILEDSPRCPYCERFISEEDQPPPGKPLWVILTALICLAMALWWVFAAL
jgi:hypothetical protein